MKEESKEEKCDNCMIGYCSYCEKGQTKMYCDCTHTPQEEKKDWEENKKLEEIWDYITSMIGFDERQLEIHEAIRRYVKLEKNQARADLIKELRDGIKKQSHDEQYTTLSWGEEIIQFRPVITLEKVLKRLGDKAHIDYERNESHYHCWNQVDNEDNDIEPLETPACGQKLEDHKQCCLCDTPYPQEEKKEYIKKLECGCWETTNESGVGAGSYCINHAPIREDFGENPLHISAEALLECNFRTKELLKKARQEGYEEGRKYTLDDLLKQAEKAKQIARADLIKELREVRDSDSCECDNCHRVRKFIKKYENQ